jgi:hypothetical protein
MLWLLPRAADAPSVDAAAGDDIEDRVAHRRVETLMSESSSRRAGTLAIYVGGEEAVMQRARPFFETVGDPERIFHPGSSSRSTAALAPPMATMPVRSARSGCTRTSPA